MKRVFNITVVMIYLLIASQIYAQSDIWKYLGQTPPGDTAKLFAPKIMQHQVHSCPTFTPDGKEIYWSTVCEADEIRRIKFMKYENGQWTGPHVAPFSGTHSDDHPFISHDGTQMIFASGRPSPRKGLSFWSVRRDVENWTDPVLTNLPITAETGQWTPSSTNNGTLCFTAHMEGVRNNFGIYISVLNNGQYSNPIALPECVNKPGTQNWTPFIAPDGSFILFASGRPGNIGAHDLYITYQDPAGQWNEPVNLGPKVNTQRQERFPGISPDGKYLFFTRHYSSPCYHDLYWIETGAVLPELKNIVFGETAEGIR